MAAFDSEAAARQGRSGDIPPMWTRFPISRAILWLNLIGYGLGALALLGIPTYLLITANQSISFLEASAGFILGFIFLFISLRLLPPLLQSARHFFLVTPDGFVQVAGKKIAGLPFTEISGARTEPGLLGAKLVVQQRSGKALALPIGRVYGGPTLRKIEEALTANITSESQKKTPIASVKASGQKKARKARR